MTGKKVIWPEDVRHSLEAMNVADARLKELGLEGLRVHCEALLRGP